MALFDSNRRYPFMQEKDDLIGAFGYSPATGGFPALLAGLEIVMLGLQFEFE